MMPMRWSRSSPIQALPGDTAAQEGPALPRLWRGFMTARVFFGGVLLLLQGVSYGLGQPVHVPALVLSGAYLVATLLAAALTPVRPPMRTFGIGWLTTIGIDLATFALLQSLQQGNINFTPLFALPALMGAVLGSMLIGLGTTALISLLLLADAGRAWLINDGDLSARLLQAGLTGTGLFMVALLAHELSQRLVRQEALALHNRDSAQMQTQVNAVVIETLTEGVLVVDVGGHVHAANPALHAILGLATTPLPFIPFSLDTNPAWQALATLARDTFADGVAQSAEVPIAQSQGAAREIRVRTQLTSLDHLRNESLCVMFLEDLRELEARIRTEKLAAMGRLSAAVAHEIRNPLAAITQASALLGEDLTDPTQRQLTTIVQQNAQRLARIVDDVLDVARARQHRLVPPLQQIALDLAVRTVAHEWAQQTRRQGMQVLLEAPDFQVRFEVEHLRRILVNLLDNAARYASDQEGSIRVGTRRGPGPGQHAALRVWSDGAPLDAAVQRHLFEPFFSSESRSSGLGLFLCRELCEQHGATIGYQRRASIGGGLEGNEFFVSFALAGNP